ncbi:hypothetical protein [Burkholderia sp. Ac-20349]|uniref:hypothetical protein n=1 Tax=Burkholderia sp. Ac-20349 TaxID=2703893 RepID=UPI00197B3300|nr:hypothetical protein [Burkholderia sp. Ac-20349]MBN3839292.1 hypothetical protein [Burkholderia sp. Ac-20349]
MKRIFDWVMGLSGAALLLINILRAVQEFDAGHYWWGAFLVAFALFWFGSIAADFPPKQGSRRAHFQERASNYTLYRYFAFVLGIHVTIFALPYRLAVDVTVGAAAGVFYATKRTWHELRDIFILARAIERHRRVSADPDNRYPV